jgi:biotin operon repressor
MTKTETVLKILKDNAESGISAEELMKACKITKSAVFSAIYGIRQNKYKIITKNFRYFWKSNPAIISNTSGKEKRAYVRHAPAQPAAKYASGLPFPLPKGTVPADKKASFVDMIGQAAFYYKCAEALITSERLKHDLSS